MVSINNLLSMSAEMYTQWLIDEYCSAEMEADADTVEGLKKIGNDMVVLANQYTFLASVLSVLKYSVRNAKDLKNKALADDLIDKKEATQRVLDSIKARQATLSRLITIRQEINQELFMERTVYEKKEEK